MESHEYKRNVLVLFAHPALQKSRVNRKLVDRIRSIDGITFHDLYETYHDFHINVAHEQALLSEHDIIVFQHPIFWFSVPALLKEWMDLVLQHGWAYGKTGKALKGKLLLSVISTGGRESLYQKDGYNRHTVAEFLAPISQTAVVCGMRYLPPFVVHGTNTITLDEIQLQSENYEKLLKALRDNTVDLEEAERHLRINENITGILMRE